MTPTDRTARAAASLVLAVVAVAGCTSHPTAPDGVASGPPSPSPSPSECALRVVESGFTIHDGFRLGDNVPASQGEIMWGLVLDNPCPATGYGARLAVFAVDAAGHDLQWSDIAGTVGSNRQVPVIGPGQRLGITGQFNNGRNPGATVSLYDPTKVASLRFHIQPPSWRSPGDTVGQVTATATTIAVGRRGAEGYTPVTFRVTVSPTPGQLGFGSVYVLIRNTTGKIISGQTDPIPRTVSGTGDTGTVFAWVPAGAGRVTADVYIAQGQI